MAPNEQSDPGRFRRERERSGRVPFRTQIFQGVGALPDTFKTFAINTFLLLYYNQVLGLPALHVSGAMFIALLVDAVTDPMVGSYSDRFRSRLGRRHPFMYASALPLGICCCFLFAPPEFPADWPREPLLLAWLGFFLIATRVCMTFFMIPWSALFAELSDDYLERSAIVSYRFFFGWLGGITLYFSVFTFIFPSTAEYPLGQLNPESYRTFAAVLALCIASAVLITTHFTRDQIPFLMQPQSVAPPFSLRRVIADLRLALENPDFLTLFCAVLASAVVVGTMQAFEIYMATYFWGLDTVGLRWLALSFTGALLAFLTVVPLQARVDKKHVLIGCSVLLIANGMLLVGLRFLDVLPSNGSPLLLKLLVADSIVRAYLGTTALIMFTSMMADTLDVQELNTGQRQEGLFNSALAFSAKATSGLGTLITGVLLDAVIRFPVGAAGPVEDAGVVTRLGVIYGFVVPLFNVLWMVLVLRYTITRERHAEVRRTLEQRRAVVGGPARWN